MTDIWLGVLIGAGGVAVPAAVAISRLLAWHLEHALEAKKYAEEVNAFLFKLCGKGGA